MLPEWNLDSALAPYGGDSDVVLEQFHTERLRLAALLDELDVGPGPAIAPAPSLPDDFDMVITGTSRVLELERVISLYHCGRCWADGTDTTAAAKSASVHQQLADTAKLSWRTQIWAARLPIDWLTARSATACTHRYWLERCTSVAARSLAGPEEDLVAHLDTATGREAWRQLHGQLSAGLAVHDGEAIVPVSLLRHQFTSPIASDRWQSHQASEEAWASIAGPSASALNALGRQSLLLAERRGWSDPLTERLEQEHISHTILDAVHHAVIALRPALIRFTSAKASLLGLKQLPFQDLLAPLPWTQRLTWPEATDLLLTGLAGFSSAVTSFALNAVASGWIDAQIRPGKRSTALCLPFHFTESRIMFGFDGSADSVYSAAHELGHAYHHRCLAGQTEWLRQAPLCLREIPSMTFELVLASGRSPGPQQRIEMLHAHLIGIFQTCIEGYARFRFEQDLLSRLRFEPLTAAQLTELNRASQEEAFGDTVAHGTAPAYAWVSHPHLYSSRFNSLPYYFARLAAMAMFSGLTGPDSASLLDDLLPLTGSMSPTDLAARAGHDIASAEFWSQAVYAVNRQVDEFTLLAQKLSGSSDVRIGGERR